MTWWWHARALTAVTVAYVLSLAVAILVGGATLALPSLVGALLVPVVFAFLLPLVPVVGLWYGLDRSVGHLDDTAVRDVAARDLAAAVGTLVVTGLAVGLTAIGDWWPLGPGYLRNLMGCLGLALLVTPFLGTRLAALVPVAAVIISALFGTGDGGFAQWWAWPVAEAHSIPHFAEGAIVLIAGLAVRLWQRVRPWHRLPGWLPAGS